MEQEEFSESLVLGSNVDEASSPELDLGKLLQECSDDKLRKLGYVALEAEHGDEPSKPEGSQPEYKKQKMSKPDFDDLMADSWNVDHDGKP